MKYEKRISEYKVGDKPCRKREKRNLEGIL